MCIYSQTQIVVSVKIGNIYYYNWTLNAFEVESIFVKS